MMERRTEVIMVRLDGLLGNRSGSSNRGAHSREANREIRVNEHPNRGRTYGSTRGKATYLAFPPEIIGRGVQRTPDEVLLTADRPRANDLCEARMRLGEVIPQAGPIDLSKITSQRFGQKVDG